MHVLNRSVAALAFAAAACGISKAGFFFDYFPWLQHTKNAHLVATFDAPTWPIGQVIFGAWHLPEASFNGLAGTPSANMYVMPDFASPLSGPALCAQGMEDIEIRFSQPVRAAAFEFAISIPGNARVQFVDDAGRVFGDSVLAAGSVGTIGFVSTGSFRKIRFSGSGLSTGDNFIDSVSVGDHPCPADFNSDGLVNDTDFISFARRYDLVDCNNPAMGGGCPGDLNRDWIIDDADFQMFAVAYDSLLCD